MNLIIKLSDGSYGYVCEDNNIKYSQNTTEDFLLTYYIYEPENNKNEV